VPPGNDAGILHESRWRVRSVLLLERAQPKYIFDRLREGSIGLDPLVFILGPELSASELWTLSAPFGPKALLNFRPRHILDKNKMFKTSTT
jgi:hypothetical protein